ncbi:MAG: hypothetical protein PWQ31_1262 [Eubacteriales bacterium]|nr:hypothetical protein [Eubacteriales bacterium]
MKYTLARPGRIFILRLEDGDRLPDTLEQFAREQDIAAALVFFLGGVDGNSRLVVGPQDGSVSRPVPVITGLSGVSEAVGLGTLFRNAEGKPVLHLHAACGRGKETVTGCTRAGVGVWHIGEVVVLELLTGSARREVHPLSGFELLEIKEE